MAETPSTMIPLGTIAPAFTLPDAVSGKLFTLADLRGDKGLVVMFICNHCPYVKHIQTALVNVANEYQAQGVNFVAINANDAVAYPSDDPKHMKLEAEQHQYSFPYLFDESQAIARAYHAACTPDFYLFDNELKCVYRGRFDDSTPGNHKPVTGKDLSNALHHLVHGLAIDADQKASVGCNIKWKR